MEDCVQWHAVSVGSVSSNTSQQKKQVASVAYPVPGAGGWVRVYVLVLYILTTRHCLRSVNGPQLLFDLQVA